MRGCIGQPSRSPARHTSESIEALNAAIEALADGDLTVGIAREGSDELSRVAAAVEVLKANAIRARELDADRERFRIDDLKRREASFRLLFLSNPIPMWVRDRTTGGMIAVNDSSLGHYGYSPARFLAMAAADLLSPGASEPAAEAVNGGQQQRRKANGEEIEVAIYERSLAYDGHDAALVVAIDLTERRRAE